MVWWSVLLCFWSLLLQTGGGQDFQVLIEPAVVSGSLGQLVNITCIVGPDEPSSTQLLTNDNQLLPATLLAVSGNTVVFRYGPLTAADNGRELTCRYSIFSATGSLTVFSPPVYSVESSEVSAALGEALTLAVSVTGNPLPSDQQTSWTHDGSSLPPGVVATYNSLQFSALELYHDGLYTVSSRTSAGASNNLTLQLNVLYPPVFLELAGENVVCSNNSCALLTGNTGSLQCSTQGNPPPTLAIISPDPLISGDLISGVISVDPGISPGLHLITCSASNTQGSVMRTIRLLVGGVPSQPGLVVATVQGDYIVISWSQSSPESVDSFQFTVRGVAEGNPLISGTLPSSARSYSLLHTGFSPGQQFDFELTAVSLLGESPPAGTRFIAPLGSNGSSSGTVFSGLLTLSSLILAVILI